MRTLSRPSRAHALRLLALCALLTIGPGAAAADARSAMFGHWLLDARRSDDARDALDDAVDPVARMLTPSRDRTLPARGTPRRTLEGQLLSPVRLPEREVTLARSADAVVFRFDGGAPETLYTDGRPSVVDADNHGVRNATWEGDVLWVERSSDRGTRVEEAWQRTGPDLTVRYEVRNGLFEEPVRFTLILTPAASDPKDRTP